MQLAFIVVARLVDPLAQRITHLNDVSWNKASVPDQIVANPLIDVALSVMYLLHPKPADNGISVSRTQVPQVRIQGLDLLVQEDPNRVRVPAERPQSRRLEVSHRVLAVLRGRVDDIADTHHDVQPHADLGVRP